jgi:glycosyltransferase involved in cell wall biosynthesis
MESKKEIKDPTKPSRPKVLMIGWHSCVRMSKEVKALMDAGYEIDLLTCRLPYDYNKFGLVYSYYDIHQFRRVLVKIKDNYDIIHIHNEPNVLVTEALVLVDKPVVFDAHDLNLLRVPACQEDEIISILYCDGMLNVSKGIDDYIRKVYRMDKFDIPSEVVYSWCPEEYFIKDIGQTRNGIVYEGGVKGSYGVAYFGYRNIEPIAYRLTKEGFSFDIFCELDDKVAGRFTAMGCNMRGSVQYFDLLHELSKFKWGWAGFNNDPVKKHIQYVATNKFFEYIAAGTPILTYMTEEQNEFIKKYEIGVVVDKLKDVGRLVREADWEKLHKNILANRGEFTMEKQLPVLERMYERAAAHYEKNPDRDLSVDIVDYTSKQNFPVKPDGWWIYQ